MDIKRIIKEIVTETINFKELENNNKYTLPKIPTKNVFLNNPENISNIRKEADQYFDGDKFKSLPVETINIKDIVPTQRNLTINNIRSTMGVENNIEAFLLKYGNKYYILDGHHRIASNILKGATSIKAYVFSK